MRLISKHVLLVEPKYYTRFPPLGLLKLSSYYKKKGNTTEYVRGEKEPEKKPDLICVTSLFTFSWKPVHKAVKYYKEMFPGAKVVLGGIYASLMPEHAKTSGADKIHVGLFKSAEGLTPDYDLVPEWKKSIIFSSRGCIRRCPWCAVPELEGKPHNLLYSIKHLVHPSHKEVILWDNNILASKNWRNIFDELIELNVKVDFNQGIDARLITDEVAEKLSKMRFDLLRLAYDDVRYKPLIERAIKILEKHGIRKKKIVVYTLFNFGHDSPADFFERVRDLLSWGVCSYPMRFQPLDSTEKNSFIASKWTKEEIGMVEKARRVLGFGGVLPPYKGLILKIQGAKDFSEAFSLRPPKSNKQLKTPEQTETPKNHIHRTIPRWGGELNWRDYLISSSGTEK